MLDMKNAKHFEEELQQTHRLLLDYSDLVGSEASEKIEGFLRGFQKSLKDAAEKNRTMKVGVIGAMKAGKSSFLNTFIFGGEDLLPKSCIPMTAALTKISYSSTPRSVVHFYEQSDWGKIETKAQDIKNNIEKQYQAYLQKKEEEHEHVLTRRLEPSAKPISRDAFISQKMMELDDSLRSYIQLVDEVKRRQSSILDKLGRIDEIKGCTQERLNQYVGADGLYTPIVNYIEVFSDSEILKEIGIEIIDTPGLNDPVISRSVATMRFLEECDAVLLLSPCAQFMDENDVKLMLSKLPSANINEYLVVGSKLDAGILDYKEKKCPFEKAYKETVLKKRNRYGEIVRSLLAKSPSNDALEKLSHKQPALLSSLFKNWSDKLKTNKSLNEDELAIKSNLKNRFSFEPNYKELNSLSGIKEIHTLLNKIAQDKENIISARNETLVSTRKHDVIVALNSIIADTAKCKSDLETADIQTLKEKIKYAEDALNTSRRRLASIFEVAANGCDAKLQELKSSVVLASKNHLNFTTEKQVRHSTREASTGFLGLFKKTVEETHVTYSADTAQVIDNLVQYVAEVTKLLSDRLQLVIDEASLKKNVKETMLEAFNKGDRSFDEGEVLDPLNVLLSKIKIPEITMKPERYVDQIRAQFPAGVAYETDISLLHSKQSELITSIQNDVHKNIDNVVSNIKKMLNEKAESFTDDFAKKMIDHQKRIQYQIAEREKNISRYENFISLLKNHIDMFKGK